jgi:hypothetical protein
LHTEEKKVTEINLMHITWVYSTYSKLRPNC